MSTRQVIERPELPPTGRRAPRDPRTVKRIATFGSAVLVLLSILVIRLWFLQVVGGRELQAQAVGNSVRVINIPAPRGEILDRNGQVLATTRPAWDVVALPQDLFDASGTDLTPAGTETLSRIARILHAKPADLRRRMIQGNKRAPYKSVVLAADIDNDLRLPLTEKIAQYPGIRLEQTFRRSYPHPTYLSHILGFVGPITEAELPQAQKQGYRNDAIIGQDGLEARYESFLKGVDGERRVEVDAAGQPIGRGTLAERPPQPGLTLQTTIDFNVQKVLEDAVSERVRLHSVTGGGAVVMDVKTGEIVAMGSYPPSTVPVPGRPDQIRPVMRRDRDLWRRKTYNRALWPVSPASTFKPIVALTALNAGYLRPDEYLKSPKFIQIDGFTFHNFRDRKLDDMQVRRALAMSSDTFFYQVGNRIQKSIPRADQQLGHTRLREWAQQLGFGQLTGIDLPGDHAGALPDRDWKRANKIISRERDGNLWRSGDTINMAVGQGFLTASPLQMARAYAALVSPEHKLLQPIIAKAVDDPKSGQQITDQEAARDQSPLRPINPGVLEPILGGLHDVTSTPDGTAWAVFSRVGGLVAGKTGTAENNGKRDHAWFVGYGPVSDPKYVVAVMIEYSGLGAEVAAPAACRIMAAAIPYDPARCGTDQPTKAGLD